MNHTEGPSGEERTPGRPEAPGEARPAQDAILPWEVAESGNESLLPPAASAPVEPDPSATLPWEPFDVLEELSSPRARHHDEELPDWLRTEGIDSATGENVPYISMTTLESLAAAELDPPPDEEKTGRFASHGADKEATKTQALPEPFDVQATVLRPRPPAFPGLKDA